MYNRGILNFLLPFRFGTIMNKKPNEDFISVCKKKKFFSVCDLIVYVVIAVLLLSLFLGVYACNDTKNANGFKVMRGDREILSYTYGVGLNVNRGYELNVTTDGNKITLNFNGEYNVLAVDDENMVVKVTDASCKTGDCISSGELSNKGVIMCLPNGIKVLPLVEEDEGLIVGFLDEFFN